jgi:hypothetical protein
MVGSTNDDVMQLAEAGAVDERQARQAVVFRVDKGDIRAVLAGLEARTGRRVEYQDDQARKGVN